MNNNELNQLIINLRENQIWKQDFKNLYDVLENGLMKIDLMPKAHLAIINLNLTSDFILNKINNSLKKHDLSIAQKNILEALFYSNSKLNQKELSKFVLSSKSNISSILERMENKELITRYEDKNNKRIKLVKITPKGEKKILEILNLFCNNVYKNSDSIITDKEAEELNRLLFKVKKGFENLFQ